MPIFEYTCSTCHGHFEKLTTRAKADEVACTACGSTSVRRRLSVFGVGAANATSSAAAQAMCGTGACSLPQCAVPQGGCGTGMCGMN